MSLNIYIIFFPTITPSSQGIPNSAMNPHNMKNAAQANMDKVPPPCIFLNFCFEYNIYIYMLDKKNKKNKKK